MRIGAALIIAVLLGLSVPRPGEGAMGEVTIALPGEPTTMDPHVYSDFIGVMIWRWSYDTLLTSETGTGKLAPWLAERWEKLNPKAYKFWLRKGVKFTDGSPLTAAAVKYSFDRVMDPALKSWQRPFWRDFDRIEVLDDHTFIFHSKVSDNALPLRLTRWGFIMSQGTKGMERADISRNTFGAGPYILKAWTKGQKMVFEANPNWWANRLYPKRPKTIILRRIPESITRVKALLAGEVDVIMRVESQLIPQIQESAEARVETVPAIRIAFLTFVTTHGGPFADQKVRLAVNYAVDAESMRKTLVKDLVDPFGQLIHPWNYVGYSPNKTWYGYDLAKAKALMKESSYANGFKATLYATSGRYPADREVCEAVSGMVKKIGVDLACRAMTYALWAKVRKNYQEGKTKDPAMFSQAYGGAGGDPTMILRATSSCGGHSSNHCFKDLDAAIDKAVATVDLEEQQLAYEKVTDIMKEKAMHKILWKLRDVYASRKRVEFKPRQDETLFPWEIVVK